MFRSILGDTRHRRRLAPGWRPSIPASQPFTVRRSDTRRSVELPPLGQFIGGAFRTRAAEHVEVLDPSTGTLLAEVPVATQRDVDDAVDAASDAFAAWSHRTPAERSAVLLTIADAIEENAQRFRDLEAANTGKPRVVLDDDVASAIDTFRFMAGAVRALDALAPGDDVAGHTSYVLREPVGVVGVITPWNYPLLQAAWKIAPIIGASNTLVLKPSEITPLTTFLLADLLAALVPPGIVNVVNGPGPTIGNALASHPGTALTAVTGSIGAGAAVAAAAAPSRKRVHLELGGKAPVLVFADADLAAAAAAVRSAGFWNTGQECGAACRVLVHESVADGFEAVLAAEVSAITIGAPGAGDDIEVGPLTSQAHFERVSGFVERAVTRDGMRAVVGGHRLDEDGYFFAPTLLVGGAPGAEATRAEIFGPVVTVERFADEAEAITRANETEYGLAASVWTNDAKRSIDLPRALDFGTVWVNSHLVVANEMPWGGFKGSGYGRDLSRYALDDYSRTKHVMLNHER